MIFPAKIEDANEIADLWNFYVENSTATFRSQLYTKEEIATLLEFCTKNEFPFLTARNETLLGFALYKQFRNGNGYRHTMEHTIYLHAQAQGRGIGRKLMNALEKHAKFRNVHSFIGGVTAANKDSIQFHERLGFRVRATLPEIAEKFGKWHDIAFMQKIL